MKKINLKEIIKWSFLTLSLLITVFMVLTIYRPWEYKIAFGPWKDSSILGNSDTSGYGAGYYRLKQLIIAFLGGGALAFAGAMLQKVTRNNLAEVSILGIGSINIMFIFAYVFIFKDQVFGNGIVGALLPIVTISASILGTMLVWIISRSKRANKNTFVIVGIASQLFFEALSVVFINPSQLQGKEGKKIWSTIKNYTMGQIRNSDTSGAHPIPYWLIIMAAVVIVIIIVLTIFLRKKIDIYESSEDTAVSLGINVKKLRITMFLLVALLAGVEATILGTVALLGIIAPSIARLIFKNKFLPFVISSFIIGGILVTLASFISTSLGTDLPPGILATAIASPYFIFLILRGK